LTKLLPKFGALFFWNTVYIDYEQARNFHDVLSVSVKLIAPVNNSECVIGRLVHRVY